MSNDNEVKTLKKITIITFCAWSAFMAGIALYAGHLHQLNINHIARHIAIETFNKGFTYRRWVAKYGGVYVPVSAETTPNPYLANMADRDITSRSGMKLTMINPAYMTRMVHEMPQTSYGAKGHITSLKPIRPENLADAWEKQALLAFATGKTEISARSLIAGKPYLRYMRRILTEKNCLQCHAGQGYHLGDIRGGVSVSIPLLPLTMSLKPQLQRQLNIYLLLYLLGSLAIFLGFYYFRKDLRRIQRQGMWLNTLFDSSPFGIVQARKRILQNVNEQFCAMTGYSRTEVIGKNARFLYPDDDEYEKVSALYKDKTSLEVKMSHKNGERLDLLLTATHLNPADLSAGTIFTFFDISARKSAEDQLISSEKKFRQMMESMRDPVYISSNDRVVEYMNPAMIRSIGRDATGEPCYRAIHNLDEPCPWCKEKEKLTGTYFETKVQSPRDDHAYIVSHSPFHQDDGSIATMTIYKDITEIEAAKAQLQQSQKMEAIGILAGGVAHDFNNILTVIRGHAEMGLMKVPEDSREYKDFTAIEKASERAKQLTYQLLAFSRKQRIQPKKLMVRDVLLELDKMLRRLIGEDITINTSFAGKSAPILADHGQLDQIIFNLVVNAVDAIQDNDAGKPRVITISTSQVDLDNSFTSTHTGSTAGTCLLLEIADTGSGMSKETSDHIFEPFYTTKEQGKGTGLGLATVYGIVKQNHGYITVDSTPGEGTSFKIYWPVIEDIAEGKQEEEKEEESREPQVPGGTETILLVEDDEILRNITCHHLRHRGYNVIEAENGVDALEKASSAAVDLLFTDMVMPVMNGWELGEKIKSIHPDIEILYTSGYFDDRWKNGNISPPEERFIDKPYDPREVLVWIRKLLGGRS